MLEKSIKLRRKNVGELIWLLLSKNHNAFVNFTLFWWFFSTSSIVSYTRWILIWHLFDDQIEKTELIGERESIIVLLFRFLLNSKRGIQFASDTFCQWWDSDYCLSFVWMKTGFTVNGEIFPVSPRPVMPVRASPSSNFAEKEKKNFSIFLALPGIFALLQLFITPYTGLHSDHLAYFGIEMHTLGLICAQWKVYP